MMYDIDTTKVDMVRSAKGCDMLCVDNYLYHYDDRGFRSYRWVCNKRKDKQLHCRARLITAIVDETDVSRHCIKKVVGEHTHPRCLANEIYKAYERKRLANLAGDPCTLVNKLQNRRQRRIEEFEESLRADGQDFTEEDDGEGDVNSDLDANRHSRFFSHETELSGEDNVHIENNEPSDAYVQDVIQEWQGYTEAERESTICVTSTPEKENKSIYFEDGAIYLLKMPNGRQLACMNGQLYRLTSKMQNGTMYRWECVRQLLECHTSMYTQRGANGRHRLKQLLEEHTHEAYTAGKLTKVIAQNHLSLTIDETSIVYSNDAAEFKSEPDEIETSPLQGTTTNAIKRLAFKPRVNDIDHTYELCDDPMSALVDKSESSTSKTKKKFTFLPSAKGNKVLCLDNFIYHFDSRSNSNGHAYWTCILRRHKQYKCNGRITTKMTTDGPRILKVSGTHEHPNNANDIRRRLYKSIVTKKTNEKPTLKPREILSSSMSEVGVDFQRIAVNSKESIERCIGRLRYKQKLENTAKFTDIMNNSSDSVSSYETHHELNESAEQAIDGIKTTAIEKSDLANNSTIGTYNDLSTQLTHKDDWCAIENIEDIIEELPMDEEYLEMSAYDYEEQSIDIDNELNEESIELLQEETPVVMNNEMFSTSERLLRKRKAPEDNNSDDDEDGSNELDMDINQLTLLCSAKGGELLCIDGFLYHLKSTQKERTYWSCIKCKDRAYKCQSRVVTTVDARYGIRVIRVTNRHTHGVFEEDIKRRICNELTRQNTFASVGITHRQLMARPLYELNNLINKPNSTKDPSYVDELQVQQFTDDNKCYEEDLFESTCSMKLYAVSDGPPSLAVRMALKALNLPYELINVEYMAAEHMTENYAKMNPQKEIPVLDDNGFYLSESIAILQYLCDKYAPDSPLYPKDPTARALVNHRLCFNMGFYYSTISAHVMAPIFFDYKRTDMSLKKLTNALGVFETYLKRSNTKYAAGDHLTIADFGLVSATLCLEAIGFDLSPYPLVKKWYETFKNEHPELWEVAQGGMKEIKEFEENPPDLSHMNHPFHPTRKLKQ